MSPFLSLCMIVKNEEKVLRRCLDSVKDGVDEIVIIDTGSEDMTKKIAYEYTDKVFDYEWTNSFSDARNFAQSKASGKWILVMDADEYVYLDNLLDAIDQLKKDSSCYDAYDVKIFSFTGFNGQFTTQHWHTRIYKNDPLINYERAIHEQIHKNNEPLSAGLSELILYHSGYLARTVSEKDKRTRNKMLIDKEIKKSGLTGFDYFNLGNEYSSRGEKEKGLECYIKAYQNKPAITYSWVSHCLIQMVNCLADLKRYQDALNVIYDTEMLYPHSPDFKSVKARIYILQGRLEDAKHELIELIENGSSYQQIISSPDHLNYYPNKWMGIIYEKQNKVERAVFYYSKALSYNFNDDDLINRYFSLLLQHSTPEEVYQFIKNENWLDNEVNDDRLMKVLISMPGSLALIEKLSYIDMYKENRGINIKLLWRKNQTDEAFKQLNQLSFEQLLVIINEGFFDFLDFILLCFSSDSSETKKMLVSLAKLPKIPTKTVDTIQFLINENNGQKIEESVYLALLKRAICIDNFELFERLLEYRNSLNQDINIQIGHLLYKHDFCDLAIYFYDKGGVELFDELAYINVIDQFNRKEMSREVYDYALVALNKGFYHFSIFKYMINSLNKVPDKDNETRKHSIIKLALSIYPNSMEVQKLMFSKLNA